DDDHVTQLRAGSRNHHPATYHPRQRDQGHQPERVQHDFTVPFDHSIPHLCRLKEILHGDTAWRSRNQTGRRWSVTANVYAPTAAIYKAAAHQREKILEKETRI